jgi:tetratricopeptide (TPR) repeat protein
LSRYLSLLTTLVLLLSGPGLSAAEDLSDFQKGVSLRIEGKHAQAVEAFRKVLADSPTHVRALVQMGAALEDQGKWKEAAQAYRRALEVDSRDGSAIRNLAHLISSRSVDTPIQAPNPSKEELVRKGLQALETKDFVKASEIFGLSRGLFPNDPRPLLYAAVTLEEQGKAAAAIALYEKCIESFPDYIPARINLIVALISAGDRERAGGQAQKALELMPDNPRARYLVRLLGNAQPSEKKASLSRKGTDAR